MTTDRHIAKLETPALVDLGNETAIELDRNVAHTQLSDTASSIAVHIAEDHPRDVPEVAGGNDHTVRATEQRPAAPAKVLLDSNVELVSVERPLQQIPVQVVGVAGVDRKPQHLETARVTTEPTLQPEDEASGQTPVETAADGEVSDCRRTRDDQLLIEARLRIE